MDKRWWTELKVSQAVVEVCLTALHSADVVWRAEPSLPMRPMRVRQSGGAVNVSTVRGEEYVGLEEIGDGIWALYFADYLLARLDERTHRREELATGTSRRLQD